MTPPGSSVTPLQHRSTPPPLSFSSLTINQSEKKLQQKEETLMETDGWRTQSDILLITGYEDRINEEVTDLS